MGRWPCCCCAPCRPMPARRARPGACKSNGGFVSLDLLNTLQFAGGGSEADASNAPVAEASGTGACLSTASSSNPCPTSAILVACPAWRPLPPRTPSPRGTVRRPRPTGIERMHRPDQHRRCSTSTSPAARASASEDANGNPTASGTGSLANASHQPEPDRLAAEPRSAAPAVSLLAVQRRSRRLRHRQDRTRARSPPRCPRS